MAPVEEGLAGLGGSPAESYSFSANGPKLSENVCYA